MTYPAPHPGSWIVRDGLDLRSLALFRLGLALLSVLAIALAGRALTLPRSLSGLLIGGAIAACGALLVGYYTRIAAISTWVLTTAIAALSASPGPSTLLSITLLWAIFLPLGARYSIDSALNTALQPQPQAFLGTAVFALIAQWWSMTWFWVEGLGVCSPSGVSSFSEIAIRLASPATSGLVIGMQAWAGLLPFLLLWPRGCDRGRVVAIAITLPLWISVGVVLGLVLLPAIALVMGLALIPTSLWEGLAKRCYGRPQAGLNIYYDADCGFCKKVVHLIRTLAVLPHTPLHTAQSDPVICAAMEAQNSWVVVDWQGHYHYKFEAIAYVCSLSPVLRGLEPLLRWSPVMAIGTRFYEAIANNRRRAGY
ncbi:MAG: DUF393 domain-containing protein, partial [Leptolyngbyaceae cyanobacterium T60_A2020_046]|nr:DUF393 domain-containing protein [Leptolyngbyaceae cyanobacterium T60_A2020_046]